jgi:hypothetical protein
MLRNAEFMLRGHCSAARGAPQPLRAHGALKQRQQSSKRSQLFGGYRDISLKIKMAFTCMQSTCAASSVKFVPMRRWGDSDVKRLVFEIQLQLEGMQLGSNALESELHHHLYVDSRNVLSI